MSEPDYRALMREARKQGASLSARVFDIQQECARLDFTTRGGDETAKWVAEELNDALARAER